MATPPQETIIPLDDLPDCAADCGPLFDANGACVPPITPDVDEDCFCNHDALAGFKTGTEGVCDEACSGGEDGLVAIQNWFAETCDVEKVGSSGDDDGDSSGDSDSKDVPNSPGAVGVGGTGQSWVEMHWRWLVMIIVLVIAIIVIWVGAFWWRRRHLRKKELKRSLGKAPRAASWGPGAAPPETEAAISGVFLPDGNNNSSTPSADSPEKPVEPEKPARSWWGGRKAR